MNRASLRFLVAAAFTAAALHLTPAAANALVVPASMMAAFAPPKFDFDFSCKESPASKTGAIKTGTPATGRFCSASPHSYNLDVKRGQYLRIQASRVGAGTFDPQVAIITPTGTTLASAAANGGSGFVEIKAPCVPSNGKYTVTLAPNQGQTKGSYSLRVDVFDPYEESDTTTAACQWIDHQVSSTKDACGRKWVDVHAPGGTVRVSKGQTKWVYIESNPDDRIYWDCVNPGESDDEKSNCEDAAANLIKIKRASSGDRIDFTCYIRDPIE